MLKSLENIRNYKVHAKNGDIGRVEDFYFDDKDWTTRYLVANCGNWVMGHQKVLIAPEYFDHTDLMEEKLYLNLTQEQVEDSPIISTHTPISKQHISTRIFTPVSPEYEDRDEEALAGMMTNPEDEHLYSLKDTKGLHIEALDGEIGHVLDFMVNDETWEIVWMIVNTHNWWPGKSVLISPDRIKSVNWPKRRIYLSMTRQEVKESHE